MRTTLLICLLGSLSNGAAQDFQHFINPNYEYYFEYEDEPGVYHTFSIVDTLNQNDTLFHFPHKVVKDVLNSGSNPCDQCGNIAAVENLHGEQYVRADGIWKFKNFENAEIHMQYDMNVTDSTLMMISNDTSYFFYRLDNSNEAVFGEMEAIANYSVKAFSNNSRVDVVFDSVEYKYSSQHGFLDFFDLFLFPDTMKNYHLIGHSSWEEGIRLKSKAELVNWQENDIYVFKRTYNDATWYYEHIVEEVQEDAIGKTIYSSVTEKVEYPFNEPFYEYYNDSIHYSFSTFFLSYPLEFNFNHDSYFSPTPSYFFRDPFFGESEFNGISRREYSWISGMPFACPDDTTCFSFKNGELYYSGETWFEELGLVSSYFYNSDGNPNSDISQGINLIAYKKGSEIYGDPYQITGLQEIHKNSLFTYPNPTQNTVRFEMNLDHYEVFDLQGKSMHSGSGLEADLGQLRAGIYLLKAYINNSIITQKIIKK
ncbi:MAG: T9SS type A sorting domain-containing protein [Bacteroidota bacterium]